MELSAFSARAVEALAYNDKGQLDHPREALFACVFVQLHKSKDPQAAEKRVRTPEALEYLGEERVDLTKLEAWFSSL